ncbi:hypothetical protein [Candidatus Avelusimicrobium alvi]|uniref:hypothetical protein n=1 Tax=Candidatus Avelusimicrobium alvi TaxID=3416221 RepID=UPI003D0C8EF4
MKKHCMLLLSSAFLYAPSFAAAAAPQLMSVSADAEVRVKPDRAAITFGLFEKTDNLRRGALKRRSQTGGRLLPHARD